SQSVVQYRAVHAALHRLFAQLERVGEVGLKLHGQLELDDLVPRVGDQQVLCQHDVQQLVPVDDNRRAVTEIIGRRTKPVPRGERVNRLAREVLEPAPVEQQAAHRQQARV